MFEFIPIDCYTLTQDMTQNKNELQHGYVLNEAFAHTHVVLDETAMVEALLHETVQARVGCMMRVRGAEGDLV